MMTLRRRPVKPLNLSKLSSQLGTKPNPFFRAVGALDTDNAKLAAILGISEENAIELCSVPNSSLGDLDPECETLLAYVNERIGMCIALRNELMAKLARDRKARLDRRTLTKRG